MWGSVRGKGVGSLAMMRQAVKEASSVSHLSETDSESKLDVDRIRALIEAKSWARWLRTSRSRSRS